jgi:drug/metabolite transporter (DMT)-like permease
METLKLMLPALLFAVSTNLTFYAAGYLTVATSQILYQMKIIATALFAKLLLRKSLSRQQWVGLVILMLGALIAERSQQAVVVPAPEASQVRISSGVLSNHILT